MIKPMLVLDTIEVQGANAISSYTTIGIPAVTAIGGCLHALERNLKQQKNIDIKLNKFAMLYKDVNLQVHKQGYSTSIKATANPSILKNTSGEIQRPPFNPEAKCHLQLTILVSIDNIDNSDKLCDAINQILPTIKLAGGDILGIKNIYVDYVDEEDMVSVNKFFARLMPVFALIERKDLMQQDKNNLDLLLDSLAVYHKCKKTPLESTLDQEEPKFKIEWLKPHRKNSEGWIVPIAVGYQGLSPLGSAKNTRDSSTPHCFAESIVTLGEFKMPHKFDSIDNMLWQYNYDAKANLYYYSQYFLEEDHGYE